MNWFISHTLCGHRGECSCAFGNSIKTKASPFATITRNQPNEMIFSDNKLIFVGQSVNVVQDLGQ